MTACARCKMNYSGPTKKGLCPACRAEESAEEHSEISRKLLAEAREWRKGKTCPHAVTEPYVWEHDSGYGRQSMKTGLRCVICSACQPWAPDGPWTSIGY